MFRVILRVAGMLALMLTTGSAVAQKFDLERRSDSLYVLTLTSGSDCDRWRLPYPVFRLEVGDLNGDGTDEAAVGVVKPTRFFPEPARRLFIFKNVDGRIRPLWLGSRLGGRLIDFRIVEGRICTLEQLADSSFVNVEYKLSRFGLTPQPLEQRAKSPACLNSSESRQDSLNKVK